MKERRDGQGLTRAQRAAWTAEIRAKKAAFDAAAYADLAAWNAWVVAESARRRRRKT